MKKILALFFLLPGMALAAAGGYRLDRSQHDPTDLVSLQAGSQGPCLRLHELASGGRTLELGNTEIGWPESWSARRAPRTVAIDLREHGSLEIDDVPE